MNAINYRVSLDMFDVSSQVTIKCKKGDSACKIHITLTENGKIYNITEGCYATFSAKKSDGNVVHKPSNCTIEGNTIVYDFANSIDEEGNCQVSACEGNVDCEVALYKGDKKLTSPHFNLFVDGTVYNGEEIHSTDMVEEFRVDQTYLPGSKNAQSGKAVAEALTNHYTKAECGNIFAQFDSRINEAANIGIAVDHKLEGNYYTKAEADNHFAYLDNRANDAINYAIGVDNQLANVAVDLDNNYVKKTDRAGVGKFGLVSTNPDNGININALGQLYIEYADNATIDAKKTRRKPITPYMLDYAVKKSITTNTETLTDAEKSVALEWLGAAPKSDWELIEDITLTEDVSSVEFSASLDGYKSLSLFVISEFANANTAAMAIRENGGTLYFMWNNFTFRNTEPLAFWHLIEEIGRINNVPLYKSTYPNLMVRPVATDARGVNFIQGLADSNIAVKSDTTFNPKGVFCKYNILFPSNNNSFKSGGKFYLFGRR